MTISPHSLSQAEPAWSFAAATTTDYLRADADGTESDAALANLTELSLTVDLDRGIGAEGGSFFVLGGYTSGDDPGELTKSAHAASNLAANDDWRLLEAWYEQRFADGRGALLGGVYAVDAEFDARVSSEVFLNGAFGTGLDWSESGAAGPGIFPETGLGLRLRYALTASLTLRVAAVDGEPSAGSVSERLKLSRNEGAFVIGEIDYQPIGEAFMRLAFGSWTYSKQQLTVDEESQARAYGAYAFWEGQLIAPPRGEGLALNGFVRGGVASEATNPFGRYLAAGVSARALFAARPDDVAGVALSYGHYGDDLRDVAGLDSDGETALEVTYALQLGDHLMLQPVLQYIVEPVDAPEADVLLYGVRVSLAL